MPSAESAHNALHTATILYGEALQEKGREIAQLKEKVTLLKAAVEQNSKIVNECDAKIEELRKMLAGRDATIKELEEKLETRVSTCEGCKECEGRMAEHEAREHEVEILTAMGR